MKTILTTTLTILCIATASAQRLYVTPLAENAARVRYAADSVSQLPELVYVPQNYNGSKTVSINEINAKVLNYSLKGDTAFAAFKVADDEYLYGLGQFQDGYSNLNGLPRRLTQVNTQISMPMIISNKGYGIIWNNYSKTDYNLPDHKVELKKTAAEGAAETVNVTTTEGGRQETRHRHIFEAEIDIPEDGEYAVLLDVGQKMARRHNLDIDGKNVIEMQNLWLPPTASKIVNLVKGRHKLTAELTENDRPEVYYSKVKDEISFTSFPSDAVDYTVIFGNTDEIIATYRKLTGESLDETEKPLDTVKPFNGTAGEPSRLPGTPREPEIIGLRHEPDKEPRPLPVDDPLETRRQMQGIPHLPHLPGNIPPP